MGNARGAFCKGAHVSPRALKALAPCYDSSPASGSGEEQADMDRLLHKMQKLEEKYNIPCVARVRSTTGSFIPAGFMLTWQPELMLSSIMPRIQHLLASPKTEQYHLAVCVAVPGVQAASHTNLQTYRLHQSATTIPIDSVLAVIASYLDATLHCLLLMTSPQNPKISCLPL